MSATICTSNFPYILSLPSICSAMAAHTDRLDPTWQTFCQIFKFCKLQRKLEGKIHHSMNAKNQSPLIYQIIKKPCPQFLDHMAQQGKDLPKYVRAEFADYLQCSRLEHGFL